MGGILGLSKLVPSVVLGNKSPKVTISSGVELTFKLIFRCMHIISVNSNDTIHPSITLRLVLPS